MTELQANLDSLARRRRRQRSQVEKSDNLVILKAAHYPFWGSNARFGLARCRARPGAPAFTATTGVGPLGRAAANAPQDALEDAGELVVGGQRVSARQPISRRQKPSGKSIASTA